MMITVASFEIASNISQDSYGLVFGINTFLALAFQVPSNFPFLNLRYKKAFIVCLETIQLSLSKLDFQKNAFLVCMQNRPEVKFFLPRQSSQRLWLTRSDSIWSLKTRSVFVFFLFICLFLLLLFFDEVGFHIIPQDQMDVFCCCCF